MSLVFKIDDSSTAAKLFAEYIKTLNFVKILEEKEYNPEFVKRIKKSSASKNRTRVTAENLWESI